MAEERADRLFKLERPPNEKRSGGSGANEPLPLALSGLLIEINRLQSLAPIGVREYVAVPTTKAEMLLRDITLLEVHYRDGCWDACTAESVVLEQIADLMDLTSALLGQRFSRKNWNAEVALIWLRLRAVCVFLRPVMPHTAGELSSLLNGSSTEWPGAADMQAVKLVKIPAHLINHVLSQPPPRLGMKGPACDRYEY